MARRLCDNHVTWMLEGLLCPRSRRISSCTPFLQPTNAPPQPVDSTWLASPAARRRDSGTGGAAPVRLNSHLVVLRCRQRPASTLLGCISGWPSSFLHRPWLARRPAPPADASSRQATQSTQPVQQPTVSCRSKAAIAPWRRHLAAPDTRPRTARERKWCNLRPLDARRVIPTACVYHRRGWQGPACDTTSATLSPWPTSRSRRQTPWPRAGAPRRAMAAMQR
mmetsp:Transcript_60884/g.132199  ORF Transcript_60884/g.132199 Transcript_60884/m.132199 type:complete len:223 (-) Transcript_60884:492-1160(-)